MATITFFLKDSKSDSETLIYIVSRFNNKRFKYSTGEKISPLFWDGSNYRAITDKKHPQLKGYKMTSENVLANDSINSQLDRYKSFLKQLLSNMALNDTQPSVDLLKREFDRKFKIVQDEVTNVDLNSYIDQYIKEIESGKRITDKGERFKLGTIKNYKGFKIQFDEFQKRRRKKLDFKDITIDFYDEFVQYFNNKSYSINTIGRHIKNLKTIMRSAKDEGIHINLEYERRKFKIMEEETTQIYLTEEELRRMFNIDLTGDKALELARDVFLIGCYTALRYSDFSRITENHIKSDEDGIKYIEIITKKTGENVIVPIRYELEQILKKYNWNVPKTYEQKINERIKEVGRLVEINTPVEIESIKGAMKVKTTVPKYTLIKTHTARRTGCTNMYLAGVSTLDIMKISSHKSEKNFMKYIKVSKEETAKKLASHPYFSRTMKVV